MQVILEPDEAWSIMTLVVAQVLDQVELSDEGKAAVRRWRSDHNEGTAEMAALTVTLNEVLGTTLDEKTTRLIRRKGWYVSTKEGQE
jgi:roadblock/LC7 domain-containing protein